MADRFSQWMANGLLATVAWFIVLVVYVTFRSIGVEDPVLGQVFMLLTGAWVAALTLAQGRKQAIVAERVEKLEDSVEVSERRHDAIEKRADISDQRADSSEHRETQWSQHKDHSGGDG